VADHDDRGEGDLDAEELPNESPKPVCKRRNRKGNARTTDGGQCRQAMRAGEAEARHAHVPGAHQRA